MKQEQQTEALRLPEAFRVKWTQPDDPNTQSVDKHHDASSETKFLELSRRRGSSFSSADSFWDSCDELLASSRSGDLQVPPEDIFQPDEFRLLSKLGQGGYGCVYKAVHVTTGYIVALKELTGKATEVEIYDHRTLPWDCGVVPCYGTFRGASNSCSTTSTTINEDQDKSNKVTAVTTKETAALAEDCTRLKTWLILKYCKGASLVDKILENGQEGLSERDAARMAKQVVKTLLYLKEHHGIVHNDIKPANLLANEKGDYYVCDLGAARKGLWQKERLGGTYAYMPPEKLRARKLTGFLTHYCNHEKHDVWSLGATIFASIFARHPFNARALAKCTTVTSSGEDASRFYDLMETNFDTIQYPKKSKRVISVELKNLLQGMLTPSCLERLTLACVKEDSWVQRKGGRKLVWSHAKSFVRESLRTLRLHGKSDHVTEDQAFLKVLSQPTETLDCTSTGDDPEQGGVNDFTCAKQRIQLSSVEGTC